jgi:AGZA family xanthine/uracil permease-like MFS transporter
MAGVIEKIFRLRQNNTTAGREIRAGFATFLTMAYIIIVNPIILSDAGIPIGPSVVATILSAAFGTFIMAFYANRPFAIAPYMGENAFLVWVVCKAHGCPWEVALGVVFLSGVIFVILTLTKVRVWFAEAIPSCLKYAMAVGIGLFLCFIGLNSIGVIRMGVPAAPLKVGIITDPRVLLGILGFFIISILMVMRVRGAILIGICSIAIFMFIGHSTGLLPAEKEEPLPELKTIFTMPDFSLFGRLDIMGALHWGFAKGLYMIIIIMFIMSFLDTMGTLIGCAARAGFLDEKGNLPQIERPMMADAVANVSCAVFGTSTAGTFIESAAGIEEGGRTGLTALVVAILFLPFLFLSGLIHFIPKQAYGPALVVIGLLMFHAITRINFADPTEVIPAFATVILMCFTYNIAFGLTAGFVVYPILKIVSGRFREIHPAMWVLFVLAVVTFICYPYK